MQTRRPTLLQRLGLPAGTRALIINCDDLGLCQASNDGCLDALRTGVATSASLMVPCPAGRPAATQTHAEDVGVHLTVNAEWEHYRWAPLTPAPTLRDPDGNLAMSFRTIWERADPAEVRAECRAQVATALSWGVDVTHLDAHMYTVAHQRRLFEEYLGVAREFSLPVRLSGTAADPGNHFRARAARAGVLGPDHLVALPAMGSRGPLVSALRDLPVGVTEFHAHPARDTPELHRVAPDWVARVADWELYVRDEEFQELIAASGAVLLGYRALREAMRDGMRTGG